jgi:hypothetical protein
MEGVFMKRIGWLLAGLGLGALAAYVLDPVSGAERRKMLSKNAKFAKGQINDGIEAVGKGVESISSLIGDAPDAKTAGETLADSHSVH